MKLKNLFKGGKDLPAVVDFRSGLENPTGDGALVFSDSPSFDSLQVPYPTTPTGIATREYYDGNLEDNLIVNGAMEISQENGDTVGITHFYYPVDQFRMSLNTTATVGIAQFDRADDSTLPPQFENYVALGGVANPVAASAGEFLELQTFVEGTHMRHLRSGYPDAETVTLSWWCNTNGPKTYCVSLRNSNSNRSYVTEFTTSGTGWERFEKTIPLDTQGTWETGTGLGLLLCWDLTTGSNYYAPATDTWVDGNYVGTSNSSDFLSDASNYFRITGVDLRRGTKAPDTFQHRHEEEELRRCKRYYNKKGIGDRFGNFYYGGVYFTNRSFVKLWLNQEMRLPLTSCTKTYTTSTTESDVNVYHRGANCLQFYLNSEAASGVHSLIVDARL